MADERTTVVKTGTEGSGSGWVIAVVLVVALVFGVVFFTRTTQSEAIKDNAVTNAANNVGEAAKDVGSAAKDAANGDGK